MKFFTVFLSGVFLGGVLFSAEPVFSKGRYDKLRVYTQVFNLVEEHFVEKLQVEKLVSASIRGLLGTLDPYSGYLTKKRYKKLRARILTVLVVLESGEQEIAGNSKEA